MAFKKKKYIYYVSYQFNQIFNNTGYGYVIQYHDRKIRKESIKVMIEKIKEVINEDGYKLDGEPIINNFIYIGRGYMNEVEE